MAARRRVGAMTGANHPWSWWSRTSQILAQLAHHGVRTTSRHSKAELAKALHKAVAYAKCMDERAYDTFWWMAMHLCGVTKKPEDPLRLQHSCRCGIRCGWPRIRNGRHPDRRAGHLWRRARLSRPRSRDLRLPAPRPERQ